MAMPAQTTNGGNTINPYLTGRTSMPYVYRSHAVGNPNGASHVSNGKPSPLYWDAGTTFAELFNGGKRIEKPKISMAFDRETLRDLKGVLNARYDVARALDRDKLSRASNASYTFGRALWKQGLYGLAQDAYVFGAALQIGLGRIPSFDLSHDVTRLALFDALQRAEVVEKVDTRSCPDKLGLGESWMVFKDFLGGNVYGTYSRMLVGTGLAQKVFSTTRMTFGSFETTRTVDYEISDTSAVARSMKKELADLQRMEEAGIPVVNIHHRGPLSYLRDFVRGALYGELDHPLMGLITSDRAHAKKTWGERKAAIQGLGLWRKATDAQMRGSMVYSFAERDWVVFDTLAIARR